MTSENSGLTDSQMREPLFDYLEEFYGKIRIFEEKNAGASRADVIGVIDGALLGFEIKSDRDSYTRLKTQTRDYDDFCDINFLVVGKSHVKHAHEHIPEHWGIIVIWEGEDGQIQVEMDQLPAPNHKVSAANQLHFLWRPELARLQEMNDLPVYKARSKQFVQQKILERVPEEVLKRQITDLLFERDYQELLGEIAQVRSERAAKENRNPGKKKRRRRHR